MKKYGNTIALLSLTILLINFFYLFWVIFNGDLTQILVSILLTFIIAITLWWLRKEYGQVVKTSDQLLKENKNLEKEITTITRKLEEYESFFNTFDGTTLYIYDVANQTMKFSKGIEKLFGRTQKEMNNNFRLWKANIHKEDLVKVEEFNLQLSNGYPIQTEFRILHPQQGVKWVLQIAKPLINSRGEIVQINGNFMDITKQKELEKDLRRMAYFDDLTDMPNRKMLDQHVKKAIARSKRHDHNLTLMFIDLDDFKIVNDTLGHEAGDQLLIEVVSRLTECTREEDLISRIGGDEFIIVFEETSKEEIEDIAKRIIKSVSRPYDINGNEAKISLSIGVSMFPDDGEDKETLIQNADKAMYFAKNNGKNSYKLYTEDLEDVEVYEAGIFKKWMTKLFK